jgi:hypothetical protein
MFMKFFNRFVLLHALIVTVLTLVYTYVVSHFFGGTNSYGGVISLAAYLGLIFASSLLLGQRDEVSGYIGFNYHLTTYLVVNLIAFILVLSMSKGEEKDANLKATVATVLIWGVGVLFHFVMYFQFRKQKIGSYEKDDVFK